MRNSWTVSKKAERVLDALTQGLERPGDSRRIGGEIGAGQAFMPVYVECIAPDTYSVAHYYKQNGDLVADPEMTFRRWAGGYVPCSYAMPALGIYRVSVEFGETQPERYNPRELGTQRRFAAQWMDNIRYQQGLSRGSWEGDVTERIASEEVAA